LKQKNWYGISKFVNCQKQNDQIKNWTPPDKHKYGRLRKSWATDNENKIPEGKDLENQMK
jgi:hypothetical protein